MGLAVESELAVGDPVATPADQRAKIGVVGTQVSFELFVSEDDIVERPIAIRYF